MSTDVPKPPPTASQIIKDLRQTIEIAFKHLEPVKGTPAANAAVAAARKKRQSTTITAGAAAVAAAAAAGPFAPSSAAAAAAAAAALATATSTTTLLLPPPNLDADLDPEEDPAATAASIASGTVNPSTAVADITRFHRFHPSSSSSSHPTLSSLYSLLSSQLLSLRAIIDSHNYRLNTESPETINKLTFLTNQLAQLNNKKQSVAGSLHYCYNRMRVSLGRTRARRRGELLCYDTKQQLKGIVMSLKLQQSQEEEDREQLLLTNPYLPPSSPAAAAATAEGESKQEGEGETETFTLASTGQSLCFVIEIKLRTRPPPSPFPLSSLSPSSFFSSSSLSLPPNPCISSVHADFLQGDSDATYEEVDEDLYDCLRQNQFGRLKHKLQLLINMETLSDSVGGEREIWKYEERIQGVLNEVRTAAEAAVVAAVESGMRGGAVYVQKRKTEGIALYYSSISLPSLASSSAAIDSSSSPSSFSSASFSPLSPPLPLFFSPSWYRLHHPSHPSLLFTHSIVYVGLEKLMYEIESTTAAALAAANRAAANDRDSNRMKIEDPLMIDSVSGGNEGGNELQFAYLFELQPSVLCTLPIAAIIASKCDPSSSSSSSSSSSLVDDMAITQLRGDYHHQILRKSRDSLLSLSSMNQTALSILARTNPSAAASLSSSIPAAATAATVAAAATTAAGLASNDEGEAITVYNTQQTYVLTNGTTMTQRAISLRLLSFPISHFSLSSFVSVLSLLQQQVLFNQLYVSCFLQHPLLYNPSKNPSILVGVETYMGRIELQADPPHSLDVNWPHSYGSGSGKETNENGNGKPSRIGLRIECKEGGGLEVSMEGNGKDRVCSDRWATKVLETSLCVPVLVQQIMQRVQTLHHKHQHHQRMQD